MVYFKTNWIQDSNRWVIRKVRPWVYLSLGGFFIFHFTYYQYLGRRVVFFKKYLDWRTPEELQKDADNQRSRFGYKPRYEPTLEISIKKQKYQKENLIDTIKDTPRINSKANNPKIGSYEDHYGIEDPEKTRKFCLVLLEHARTPGTFDYTIPQTQYSLFPDVEQEAYFTFGSNNKDSRKLQISKFSA